MIQVAITSDEVRDQKGIGKVSGKPYHMRFQIGYAFTCNKDGVQSDFPDKFEMILENEQTPYPRGKYTLHPSAFQVSREGKAEFLARLAPQVAASAKG